MIQNTELSSKDMYLHNTARAYSQDQVLSVAENQSELEMEK